MAREFKAMGLVEGVPFTVKWSGERGRVSLMAEGVRRLAWLSIHGEEEQRQRAAEFLKFLEEKARAKGGEVFRKLEALLEEGRSRGVLRLVGLEKGGVKVLDVKIEERERRKTVRYNKGGGRRRRGEVQDYPLPREKRRETSSVSREG